MVETVRNLDARTSSDADGNSYYVVFCSRNSANALTKPGHAFVVWGIEDGHAQRSAQQSFGFYPDDADDFKAVFGTVLGQIKDDAVSAAASPLLTARLIVRVNKTPFGNSQSQINTWRTADYNLYSTNCISFARAVAISLGLFPPPVQVLQFPTTYMNDLIETTSRNEGRVE